MNKLLLVVPAFVLLAACGAPSVEDLMDDPKLLQQTALECAEMKRSEAAEDQACINLSAAVSKSSKKMMNDIMGQMNNM